jgi:hypothetical protein
MAADRNQRAAGRDLDALVIGEGYVKGLGQLEVVCMDRDQLGREDPLKLPKRAIAMDVTGSEVPDPAQARDPLQHPARVIRSGFEGDVPAVAHDQPAGAGQPSAGLVVNATGRARLRGPRRRGSAATSASVRKCQPSAGRSLRTSVQTGQSGGGAK